MAGNAQESFPPFGLLTSDGRTEWARARDVLAKGAPPPLPRPLFSAIETRNNPTRVCLSSRSNQHGLSGPDRKLPVRVVPG